MRSARTAALVFAIACGAFSARAQVEYKSVPLEEFEVKGFELVGQNVEIFGDYSSFLPIAPTTAANIVDPRMSLGRKALGDPEAMRKLRGVDPSTLPKVALDLHRVPPKTLQWFLQNKCREHCEGVYFRGQVVTHRVTQMPGLLLMDASRESLAKAPAGTGEAAAEVAAIEAAGPQKVLLPPGGVPQEAGFEAWVSQVPEGSPAYDRSKSVWDNMVARSNYLNERDADAVRAVLRGPDRPEDFETYYRGVRDTALAGLFTKSPYLENTTQWPRVAVVIEEAPPAAGTMISEHNRGTTERDKCWRLRATVWTGPVNSAAVEPFNWCFSETRFNVAYAPVPLWGAAAKSNMILAGQGTGAQRTDGPNPPGSPLPKGTQEGFDRQFSYTTAMVGNVLLDMGFDYQQPDGRVWFNLER